MDVCLIYKVINLLNGKLYIGQTWNNLRRRWNNHCLNKGVIKLYNAIQKYGKDNFKIELITVACTQEVADYWETYFIKQFDCIKSGYNIQPGSSRGKVSETTKKKMSAWQIGRKLSDENRTNIAKARIGMKSSEETKMLLSEQRKGNTFAHGNKGKPSPRKGRTWKLIDGKRVWLDKNEE